MQNLPSAEPITPLAALAGETLARLRGAGDPLLERLAALCLEDLGEADVALFDAAGLAAAIAALWQRAQQAPTLPAITVTATNGGQQPPSVLTVIQPDRPFLIDSLAALLQKEELELATSIHPVLTVARDAQGRVTDLARATEASDRPQESWAQLYFTGDAAQRDALPAKAAAVLRQVAAGVDDWRPMRAQRKPASVMADRAAARTSVLSSRLQAPAGASPGSRG